MLVGSWCKDKCACDGKNQSELGFWDISAGDAVMQMCVMRMWVSVKIRFGAGKGLRQRKDCSKSQGSNAEIEGKVDSKEAIRERAKIVARMVKEAASLFSHCCSCFISTLTLLVSRTPSSCCFSFFSK